MDQLCECNHARSKHDPEDGDCEAHKHPGHGLGKCPCRMFRPATLVDDITGTVVLMRLFRPVVLEVRDGAMCATVSIVSADGRKGVTTQIPVAQAIALATRYGMGIDVRDSGGVLRVIQHTEAERHDFTPNEKE
jgi:hypothetical protein